MRLGKKIWRRSAPSAPDGPEGACSWDEIQVIVAKLQASGEHALSDVEQREVRAWDSWWFQETDGSQTLSSGWPPRGQCPACGSRDTHYTDDGASNFIVCHSCGETSHDSILS